MGISSAVIDVYKSTEFDLDLYENLNDDFIPEYVKNTNVLPKQAYFIVKIPENEIIYASPEFEKLTGYVSKEINFNLLHSTIHPNDEEMYFRNVNYLFKYINRGKKFLKNGVIRTNYRMQKKNGEYISLLKEITIIKFDEKSEKATHGKILLTDISNFKQDSRISIEIITEDSYEKKLTSDDVDCKFHNLTRRENQIVKLLKQNKISAEIAKSLSISKTTVDTHRRNIIKKLGISNSKELMYL